jgi:surface polysaccharide O-acyltransferase-like enzyme
MIVFIYLFVPFMGKGLRKLNLSIISNLLLLWVVLVFVSKSIPLNMYGWSENYGSKFWGYFLYSGYLVLGYYLTQIPIASQKIRFPVLVIFVLTVVVSAGSTYFFSQKAHRIDLSMYSYLSINTIIQSIALFLLIKDIQVKNRYFSLIQSTISNYSYGIYLVHIMIIGIMFNHGIYWSFTYPLLSLPLLVGGVLVCSIAIIFVLRKIPGGKYIAG